MILAALALVQASACAAVDRDLPPTLMAWRTPAVAGTAIAPGRAVTVSPSNPLALDIAEAGTYGVAIDTGAWIDVARDGEALRSTAHGHGPACSTIRKIVHFALTPGRHMITLSRTEASAVRLMVIRQP